MKSVLITSLISVLSLLTACNSKEKTQIVKFEGASAEQKWAIKDLNPDLPFDWSTFEFLTLDLKASSTQRIDLWLYDAEGKRRVRIHPFQGAWVRASIPLFRFKAMNTQGTTMSSTYQAGLPGCWLNFHQGPFGTINHVDSLGFGMVKPIGSQTLEFRNIHLSMTPEDTILSPIPLVDEFGQWVPAEWPGKAKTLDDLKASWSEEEAALETGGFNYSKFGGYLGTKVKAIGFFRVEKVDGKWWFVDPEGYLFYSAGSTGIGPRAELSRVQGREYIFDTLPPADRTGIPNQFERRTGNQGQNISDRPSGRPQTGEQAGGNQSSRRQQTGEQPGGNQAYRRQASGSFYTWNLQRRFGPNWIQKWIDLTVRRMDRWGLNTIANWSDAALCSSQRKPYVATISGWGTNARTMGMPDVYAPEYLETVDASAARQCTQRKDDPFLIGYFIGNEPIWPGRELELTEIILTGEETPMQTALKKFLSEGDTPERRIEFVYDTYTKFVSIVNTAMKKHDPNHLNLGLRFGGSAHDGIIKASKDAFDVFSLNVYGYSIDQKLLQRIYDLSELPIIIGEFHFGTPGRGLAPGLAQVSSQEERGVAYRYYVENAASHPAVIGTHWFQWLDQPSTGRNDGENYNIGLLDVTDRPYKEFIEGMKETHRRLFDVHSGKIPPVDRQAKTQ